MMDEMIACCGLVCTECGAFLAALNDDDEMRRKTAEEWSQMGADIKPEDVDCDGCLSDSERVFSFVSECKIRACCAEKGLANCAPCDDYPCELLTKCHEYSPEARQRLDAIRADSC